MTEQDRARMVRAILNVEKFYGSQYHTSGPKAGRSFADHFVNVALVSYQLAKLCESLGILPPEHVKLSFYAGLIHDTNKILESTLRQSADLESIRQILERLDVGDEDVLRDESLKILQACVGLHQASGLSGMELLFNKGAFDEKAKILTRIVKFADKFDNFKDVDLSIDDSLKASCEAVLEELSELTNKKFQFTHLFYFKLREYRGALTEIIYEVMNRLLEEKFEMVAIARFPNGTVYLSKRRVNFDEQSYKQFVDELSDRILNDSPFANAVADAAATFSPTGVRFSDSAFELDWRSLLSRILSVSRKSKYEASAVFVDGLRKLFDKLKEELSEKSEEYTRARAVFKEIVGVDPDDPNDLPRSGKLEAVYSEISKKISIENDQLDELVQKLMSLEGVYRVFQSKQKSPTLQAVMREYLESTLELNGFWLPRSEIFKNAFAHYGKYETTCSVCGMSAEKGRIVEIRSAEGPELKVQYFTNRLTAHAVKEPRRMVCQFCRLQFLATKAKLPFSGEKEVLFILIPSNFYPQEFLEILKASYDELENAPSKGRRSKIPQNIMNLIYGPAGTSRKLPHTVFGNMTYFSFTSSAADSWQKLAALAALHAVRIVRNLPVRVLVTTDVLLLQDDIEFSSDVYIKDLPAVAQKILESSSSRDMWAQFAGYLDDGRVLEKFFEFVKQPSNIDRAALVGRLWGETIRNDVAFNLFKIFGGDEMREIQEMAKLARSWAHRRTDSPKVSDHQYLKPFTDAFSAVRKFDPKLGEDEKDLEALLLESVSRSLPENAGIDQAKAFVDEFLNFLKTIGNGDLLKGREILIADFSKYKNVFLGNIRLISLERKAQGEKSGEEGEPDGSEKSSI
ncbi:HD domain-containing protein [Thermotoga caldifontis]|uniref:HD domain-containing protein n=1 Tax=Thermotoga caldifontis TaxID=1508419 RepID=UPI00059746F1|nr:HD domain-containing protein [Thermotoga caldifontis]